MKLGQKLTDALPGSKAPAIMGGWWWKTNDGQWKWNGPGGSGGTFPRPGGDWDGRIIPPISHHACEYEFSLCTICGRPDHDGIEMEFARQLVALGWTPPQGHPVLDETETE